ncbi:Hsp20/alpha crystallin family protein [Melioribacteraceae bacterium 4301-Me]|uniref:Hsp20/alpha crystallin family protein n=1 Tax=Pyranulibacter aquaticus TaxID=3163344 RepID=UPI0035996FE8
MTNTFFELHNDIRNNFQRYLNNCSRKFPFHFFEQNFFPNADIINEYGNIKIFLEVPGVKKENIKITLQDNILTVEGEKKNEADLIESAEYLLKERYFGKFKRDFILPENLDYNNIKAKINDGILEIFISGLDSTKHENKTIKIN